MKKLKKLSKNRIPFNIVIIYGTVAVGKFTVAKKLHKLLDYKFFHNHHTHDLARQLFQRGDEHLNNIIEKTRFIVFREIAKAKINVVTTHTYSPNFVSSSGLSDPMYMKKIESIIKERGGRACFVHLIADEKKLLKRVSSVSRRDFLKLRNKEKMKKVLRQKNWKIIAPVKNNIQIDNTYLSPQKVANMIIKHFKLKI